MPMSPGQNTLTCRLVGVGPGGLARSLLQEPLQFFDAHAYVGEDPAECSFGDIATWVDRDRRAASIRVPHDAVTASDPGHLETGSL
jgi:hypothetical protein